MNVFIQTEKGIGTCIYYLKIHVKIKKGGREGGRMMTALRLKTSYCIKCPIISLAEGALAMGKAVEKFYIIY